ncbi:MAG: hypothetical protein V3R86_05855 [Candidatus Hydrothermarchaeaceae archaeon]
MCEECLQPIQIRTRPAGCMCGCNFRRFLSAGEEIEMLEQYKRQLQGELSGVNERISELKQE